MLKNNNNSLHKPFWPLQKLSAVLLLSGFCFVGCAADPNGDAALDKQEPVFSTAPGAAAEDTDSVSLKRRLVHVNTALLLKKAEAVEVGQAAELYSKMRLNLFDDESIDVFLDRVEKMAEDNVVFTGQIVGDMDSAVTIVLNGEVVVANIRRGNSTEAYEVRYNENGVHTVNLKRDDPDGCDAVEADQTGEDGEPAVAEDVQGVQAYASSARIDMLVAYTPNARIKQGGVAGIKALIQMGIADTNAAMTASGISTQVRLVGTLEVRQNETGNWSNDLSYLRGKTDGHWDEVHAERTRLGADQVTMVATYPVAGGTAGIGYVRATYSSAFTVVRAAAFSQYTFSHELGHNIGLNHSDGYVNSSGRFRTIIAYGSYTRIRRYSNPSYLYNGYRTGDSSHNEAQIINSRAAGVATFSAAKF